MQAEAEPAREASSDVRGLEMAPWIGSSTQGTSKLRVGTSLSIQSHSAVPTCPNLPTPAAQVLNFGIVRNHAEPNSLTLVSCHGNHAMKC